MAMLLSNRMFSYSALCALALSIGSGFLVVAASDLRPLYSAAMLVGLLGISFFTIVGQRRIMLVVVWILLHPMSVEKVIQVGSPAFPDFFPPSMVISASDVALGLLTLTLLAEGPRVWSWSKALTPFMLYVLWGVLVYLFRGGETDAMLSNIHNIKMLIYLFVFSNAVRTRKDFLFVLAAVLAALSIQLGFMAWTLITHKAFSITSNITGELMQFSGGESMYTRITGTVGHVNQQASYMTFFALPLFGLLAARNTVWRLGAAGVMGCTLVALILTYSRSAWLAIFVGCAAVCWQIARRWGVGDRFWKFAFPILLGGFLVLGVFSGRIADRLIRGDDGATSSRVRLVEQALDLFNVYPLTGVGTGNFVKAMLRIYPPTRQEVQWLNRGEIASELAGTFGRLEITQAFGNSDEIYLVPLPVHNKYLLVLAEMGLVGLILFLWFQYQVFRHALNGARQTDEVLLWASFGVVGAFWATQCYMNLDLFNDDKSVAILLFVPAVAMILDRLSRSEQKAGQ